MQDRVYKFSKRQKFYLFWKRAISIFGACLALLLLGWYMILVAIIQKCSSKGTVLFVQVRCGRDGKPFRLYKFRSMRSDAPHNVSSEELKDPDRYVTRLGRLMRRTSTDELPQLFNVLKGDMAFIGPRPLIYEDSETIAVRKKNGSICLRPGLSGLAQIRGRVNLDPVSKGYVDGEYLSKLSFWLDVKIFFKTIGKVLRSSDVIKSEASGQSASDLQPQSKKDAKKSVRHSKSHAYRTADEQVSSSSSKTKRKTENHCGT